MVTCEICGSQNFDKHDGFLYCSVCLTQSQDYCEQEYDYQHHDVSTTRTLRSRQTSSKTEKPKAPEDGSWTSWEAFNYILHGMTQEVKKCGAEDGFEDMVLKIWAAYLKTCEVAFISKNPEILPKLGLPYKSRDARILYRVDVPLHFSVGRKRRKRSSSRVSDISSSSLLSKRSLTLKKNKIIAADYENHLSSSFLSKKSLADETLESLNNTSAETESSDNADSIIKRFKQMMKKKDYKTYKNSYQSSRLLSSAKANAEKNIQYIGKNKLLSMIHLALLMTGSAIQLSDLLRFIREGHLSYAKVTHFFPAEVKLPKKDSAYIDVISDSYMPTHLRQRKITGQLGYFLKMKRVPAPSIDDLIDRYCSDLNLPDEIAKFSKRTARNYWPSTAAPKSKSPLPSFEAWAMVSIIFIMKLIFGMNDKTEILFSKLARVGNGIKQGELFSFEDWQKYIECRKSVLTEYHYPTQEQLNDSLCTSSKKFLEMLVKESKDEHRSSRFIPYSGYYMEESLVSGIKEKLQLLSKARNVHLIEFKPSMTPQVSHLETILSEFEGGNECENRLPGDVLRKTFKHCDVRVFADPTDFLRELENKKPEAHEILVKSGEIEFDESTKVRFGRSSKYWILEYPSTESAQLMNFKEEVLERTPRNFQWLLRECSRMLEMNMRDVYDELLRLEKSLSSLQSNERAEKRNKRWNK